MTKPEGFLAPGIYLYGDAAYSNSHTMAILRKPYTGNLYNVPGLLNAIAQLHNFVIDKRLKKNKEVGPVNLQLCIISVPELQ